MGSTAFTKTSSLLESGPPHPSAEATADAGSAEVRLGTIEPGKLADMVILDRDPFTVPPDELAKITVTHTIVGGRVVWSADAPDPSRDR
jgi:cytosine/adenosine deaminase-related metal-dependent hydrolase